MADQKLNVILGVDSSKFNANLGKAQGRLKAFGSKLKSVGSTLSTRLSLPLALAGGAAIKMAADFDKSMTQIKTLVGIAGNEVDAMSDKVKELAQSTGKNASEAAEALFFITSAGLRGAEAMEVLEQSLKGSALGLGETKIVADLATSAMNAYGSDVLSAADATDVLTASVREGKLSADSLAGAMGMVLPIASSLGVSFGEVGATFAAMSRTGTDAAVASTQLKGILITLLKPSKQAQETLEGLGLSAEGLRQQIRDKGLLDTLKTLTEAFGDNEEAQALVFNNSRALLGVMDLLGKNLSSTEEIFGSLSDASGITAEAFQELENSASFQLTKSLENLKTLFTEVGSELLSALLPAIKKIGNFILDITKKFKNLDEPTQNLILAIGGLAIAIPPLITVIGSLAVAFGSLNFATGGIAIAIGAIAAATASVIGYQNLKTNIDNLNISLSELEVNLKKVKDEQDGSTESSLKLFEANKKLIQKKLELAKANRDAEQGSIAEFFGIESEAVKKLDVEIKNHEKTIANYDLAIQGLKNQISQTTTEQKKFTKATKEANKSTKQRGQVSTVSALGDTAGLDTLGGVSLGITGDAKEIDKLQKLLNLGIITRDEFKDKLLELQALSPFDMQITKANEFGKALQNTFTIAEQVGQGISSVFSIMGSNISQSLTDQMGLFGAFAGAFIETSLQMIGQKIQENITMMALDKAIVASKAASATATGAIEAAQTATSIAGSSVRATGSAIDAGAKTAASFGPAAAFVLPALIAGAVAVVAGAFKKAKQPAAFANGGIVSGPTLGLMGEYAGAKSNPEVIAPLSKLQGMIGQKQTQNVNVGGNFRIQGQDLVLALQKADKQRNRIL
jgi:TP901 family phage tail tape measure protein